MPADQPKHVVIAGGSGFLGSNLARSLSARGDRVTVVSRGDSEERPNHVRWDGRTLGAWINVLRDADAIVNVAGAPIDCRHTPDQQDRILRSRVESTTVLGAACRELNFTPPTWVQISGAGIYGDPPTARCDESSSPGNGFLASVALKWEQAFRKSKPSGTRGVVLRPSMVLARESGGLAKLSKLARFGLGGAVGKGRQGVSWIHHSDMNRLLIRAIDDRSMEGDYIASSPAPVPNREFMREVRTAVRAPFGLWAPTPMVRFGARFILNTNPDLALYGRYVVPARLLDEGFEFEFPELSTALAEIFAPARRA